MLPTTAVWDNVMLLYYVIMVALWNRADHYIFIRWFILLLFLRLILAIADWMSAILAHMVWPYSANLRCRSEMCCTRLAITRQRMVISTSNLVETFIARCASRDKLSISVGQLERK